MRKLIAALIACCTIITLTACTQAERASYNASQDADNFRVDRRLVVINTMNGKPLLELKGKFSVHEDRSDGFNQLEVTIKTPDGAIKKHLVGLPPTAGYTVEDINGSQVSTTRYQISYLPDAIIPVELKSGQ